MVYFDINLHWTQDPLSTEQATKQLNLKSLLFLPDVRDEQLS